MDSFGSAPTFNLPDTTASSPAENVSLAGERRPSSASLVAVTGGSRRRPHNQQPRQLLSCTKCRDRKVKCDRTKPCSACCARGCPKQCEFVTEGGDYMPVQQSYELRKNRVEIVRLKKLLLFHDIPFDIDETDGLPTPTADSQYGDANRHYGNRRGIRQRQKRFGGKEWSDNIYFGSPGMASVLNELASIDFGSPPTQTPAHLAYAMPRGVDLFAPRDSPSYPFATMWNWSLDGCIPQLLSCLPSEEVRCAYLDVFQERVHVFLIPHVPTEVSKSEVERFLSNATRNSMNCPDMLALLFATLALGSQHSVLDKYSGRWVPGAMEQELVPGKLYIAAAMQALRMASFMSRPTLLGIQTLMMLGPYLINSGRFLDAWTLSGTTIRLAQSMGLHRNPKYLDPAPPSQRECAMRQTLWWWLLHMDQEYSMTLGRPLGISGIGDCPPPDELTTDPTFLRFGRLSNEFTLLGRQILSSERLNNERIDDFTNQLSALLDTMPERLQFDESWVKGDKEIPEWPLNAMAGVFYCKIHSYLILLNRQRLEKPPKYPYAQTQTPSSSATMSPPSFQPVNVSGSLSASPTASTKTTLRGRALVISSSEYLLTAFNFFHHRLPAALICWSIGQQAFNSCMILILEALETCDFRLVEKVGSAYIVFKELEKNGVHKMASLAVERVALGLAEISRLKEQIRVSGGDAAGVLRRMGEHKEGDIKMQGSAGSGATPFWKANRDTVMGNTGMILLEDPGLQSFVPEPFSPFTWNTPGDRTESSSPAEVPTQMAEEYEWNWDGTTPRDRTARDTLNQAVTAGLRVARSSGELQGAPGSTSGSAPSPYTDFPAPAAQDSPLSRYHQHLQNIAPGSRQQELPPHLRHHSVPSLYHHIPIPLVPHASYYNGNQTFGNADPNQAYDADYLNIIPPGFTATSPHGQQNLPEFTTQMHQQPGYPSLHTPFQPDWPVRPTALSSTVSEPVLSNSNHSQPQRAFSANDAARRAAAGEQITALAYQYQLPMPGVARSASLAATSGMSAEHLDFESWKRWIGGGGSQ